MFPISSNPSPLVMDNDLLMVGEPNKLPTIMHHAPVFLPPFITLETLGLLGTIRPDNWQSQDASLMDIYFFIRDKEELDELTRSTPMLTDGPKKLGTPNGVIFRPLGEWEAQHTVDIADICPPPEIPQPDLSDSQHTNCGIVDEHGNSLVDVHPMASALFKSESDLCSDSEFVDGYTVANTETIDDPFTVSASAAWSQNRDPDSQTPNSTPSMSQSWMTMTSPAEQAKVVIATRRLSTPSVGENLDAPTDRSILKRKRSSDSPWKSPKLLATAGPSTRWEEDEYSDDTPQTDEEDQERVQRRANRQKMVSDRKTKHKTKTPKRPKSTVRYTCRLPGCQKDYSRLHDRDRHETKTLAHGAIRAYACPHCEETFTRSDALKRHGEMKHGK